MNSEGTTKAPKDKHCPYCGQAFTSSSLGRHLDLYIKEKNPKAPDGIHNVGEIRKLRGSITRRQPRGGGRRDSSAPRGSQTGSKTSPVASDAESVSARSPGTPTVAQSARDLTRGLAPYASRMETTGVINDIPDAADGNTGTDARERSNSQRVFTRQMMKSSVEVKQRVQDALDTAKAAELALREMVSSWRAAKQQIDMESMPFDFNLLSLDFPALCLQCLEPPPTLFSSTPHPTSTSWSITPPGERQREALSLYFREEFRKWKISCSAATTAVMEELTYPPSQSAVHQENTSHIVRKAERAAETLEKQVAEHLTSAFQFWEQLSAQRQQELWVLEMARSIGRKQKEVTAFKGTQHALKQENANLKAQIDQLNRLQQPKEFKILPPMTMKVDEKMVELWTEAGVSGRRSTGLNIEDRHSDLNTVVSGAIERWKNVIVASRAASGMKSQRPLDRSSAPLKTPTSATHPMSPPLQRSAQQQQFNKSGETQYQASSPHARVSTVRNTSVSSAGPTASEPKTSAASTPAESLADSDDDVDADGDEDVDADADADVEMEGGNEYLSATNTPTHHSIPQMPQHSAPHVHQMHPLPRSQDQHMTAARHSPYPQRASNYAAPGLLPSQQMHMSQQTFGHQMQNLEQHLSQGHGGVGMGWNNH